MDYARNQASALDKVTFDKARFVSDCEEQVMQAKRSGDIPMACSDYSQRLSSLEKLTQELCACLAPVVRAEVPQIANTKNDPRPVSQCDLAGQIRGYDERVESVIGKLAGILSRLEL